MTQRTRHIFGDAIINWMDKTPPPAEKIEGGALSSSKSQKSKVAAKKVIAKKAMVKTAALKKVAKKRKTKKVRK